MAVRTNINDDGAKHEEQIFLLFQLYFLCSVTAKWKDCARSLSN